MVLVSNFCWVCSVRLGAIVIGVFTLVQGGVFLGAGIAGSDSLPAVRENCRLWVNTLGLEHTFFNETVGDPKMVVTVSCSFFSSLISSCVLLLYGAYQCRTVFMYPFAVFYLLYIALLFMALMLFLFLVKAKGHGLGDLILYSNLGGFTLLWYLYTWACVVSLIQIINELKRRLKHKLKVVENMKRANKNNTKGFHSYAHFN